DTFERHHHPSNSHVPYTTLFRSVLAWVMPTPILRFAPSPNGYLHLGHAFSALYTAHWAQQLGGRFLLRLEDIDTSRCRPEFADRSEEHTSELQSRENLVCRLLLE